MLSDINQSQNAKLYDPTHVRLCILEHEDTNLGPIWSQQAQQQTGTRLFTSDRIKKKKKTTFQIQINLFYDPSSTAYYPFGNW